MTFYKKKDAVLKLNKSNDNNLRLIQKDSVNPGSKTFHIFNINDLYYKIQKNKVKNKNSYYYESWLENTELIFSLDIDAPNDLDNETFDNIIKKNINKVIKYAKKYYDFDYKINNIIVLKTQNSTIKQSSHVIFRGLIFQNYKVCKNFFVRMIKEDNLEYCDVSIYGQTCLRTCYSSKKGRELPLMPYDLNIKNEQTCSINDFIDEKEYFESTLITKINELDTKKITEELIEIEYEIKEEQPIDDNLDVSKILNCLPIEYCNEYAKWNKVGMALFSTNESYFKIFDEWSKQSDKYDYKNNLKIWNGYKNSINKKMVGLNSIIKWTNNHSNNNKNNNKNLLDIIKSYPENEIKISNNSRYDISTISLNKLDKNVFIPNINKKILAIQSEKGTGKTTNLISTLFEENTPPESILFVSSRRTFGIKLVADLKKYGFKLYSDIEDQYIYNKRIIVQIDSLLRLQLDKYELIIIDECESLARYITSNHFTKNFKSSTIVNNLEFRVNDADRVIIMDADLSDRCMNYYTKIKDPDGKYTKDDIKVIINTFTPYKDYTINYMDYNNWLNEIKIKIGSNKKLVIPMASNNKAKDLHTKLKNDFPNKKIILIHKETSDEEKLSELIKINKTWINYDIVIYTPTVCMGVSFDPSHFDNIFAYGCHNSLGAQEFCQMLHRVRNPKDNNIYISLDIYKYLDKKEDIVNYEQSEEILCNDYYLTNYNLDSNLIQKKFKRVDNERVIYYPHKEEPVYDLYVRNCVESINNKLNFTACFFGYAKFKKYNLKYFVSNNNDNIINELKEIRKTREDVEKKFEIESILNSKTLTKEEYKDKLIKSDKFNSDKDIFEIRKYNFLKNYSLKEEDLTTDLIEEYMKKSIMLSYSNLVTILNTEEQNTDEKLNILKNNNLIGKDFRTCYQEFTTKNNYMYHFYAIRLLDYTSFNINNIDNKEDGILKEFIEDAMSNKINDMTLIEFLESEKYGLYKKFDCKNIIKGKILDTFTFKINIINNVINKQYGIKIKVLTKGKDSNKSYYLSTNNMWDNLPNKILPKDIVKKDIKNYNNEDILNNLDNNLFIDIDSSDEED